MKQSTGKYHSCVILWNMKINISKLQFSAIEMEILMKKVNKKIKHLYLKKQRRNAGLFELSDTQSQSIITSNLRSFCCLSTVQGNFWNYQSIFRVRHASSSSSLCVYLVTWCYDWMMKMMTWSQFFHASKTNYSRQVLLISIPNGIFTF